MSGQVEHADGFRGLGTFPSWWGFPEGLSQSEERARWVARNVATDLELKRRGLDPVEARTGQRRPPMSARAALAKVARLSRDVVAVPAPAPKFPIPTDKKINLADLIALLQWYADPSSGPAPDAPRSRTMSGHAALAAVAKLKGDTT